MTRCRFLTGRSPSQDMGGPIEGRGKNCLFPQGRAGPSHMISFMQLSLRGWAVVLQCAEAWSRTRRANCAAVAGGRARGAALISPRVSREVGQTPAPRDTRSAAPARPSRPGARATASSSARWGCRRRGRSRSCTRADTASCGTSSTTATPDGSPARWCCASRRRGCASAPSNCWPPAGTPPGSASLPTGPSGHPRRSVTRGLAYSRRASAPRARAGVWWVRSVRDGLLPCRVVTAHRGAGTTFQLSSTGPAGNQITLASFVGPNSDSLECLSAPGLLRHCASFGTLCFLFAARRACLGAPSPSLSPLCIATCAS